MVQRSYSFEIVMIINLILIFIALAFSLTLVSCNEKTELRIILIESDADIMQEVSDADNN